MRPPTPSHISSFRLASPETGSAIVTAMFTVAVISIIAATTLSMSTLRYGAVFQASSWQEALQGAEAAGDMAIAALNNSTWTGWYSVTSSTVPSRSKPTGGTAVSVSTPPATGTYYYYIPPNITHVGEGNNTVQMYVTVDTPNLTDSYGSAWYRIRSSGIAGVPGVFHASTEKLDNDLRKLSLVYDRVTGATVSAPQVRRSIEIIAEPATQSIWLRGLTLRGTVTMSGGAYVDSFDSSNSFKSTNGLYDSTKRQSHGDIATTNSGSNSNLSGSKIYGSLTYSGSPVKNTSGVTGTISTPFTQTISAVSAPTWTSGSYNSTPTVISGTMTLASGTKNHPARYKVSSLTVSGGNSLTLQASNSGNSNNYIEIWVTGSFTTSGTGYISQQSGVNVHYYVGGDISVSGSSFSNQNNTASSMEIDGISPTDGSTNKLTVSGSGSFIGMIDAPAYDITVSGSASLSGAFIGNSINISGSGGVHYDEALKNVGSSSGVANYSYASWFEDTR